MKKLSLVTVVLFFFTPLQSQDCTYYAPMRTGAEFEHTSFDRKGKKSGSIYYKVSKATADEAHIEAEMLNAKGKSQTSMEYSVLCDEGNFKIDMSMFISQMQNDAFKDMEMEMTSDYLVFPSESAVGASLPDGHMTMSLGAGGANLMSMSMDITDRKVLAKEDVTTAAGTFACTKESYNFETKMGFIKMKGSSIHWYAKDVGVVKMESFDKNGKSQGTTELTILK